MKVVMATPWLHPLGGGLERYAATLAERLAARGHDVVTLGHARAPTDETERGVRRIGVKPSLRLSNTPLSLRVARAAAEHARDADVVDVHTPVPGTAELVALATRRVPLVVTYHAGALAGPPGPLALAAKLHRGLGERWMLRRARARIAVSPYVAQHVFRALPSHVVPPGVDAERFHPSGESVPGRVLFVGPVDRAYAWKGLATLADAFERLAPFHPDAHLRLVGAGDLVTHYEAHFCARGLSQRFSIAGRVDDDELVREYGRASVVVLPSTSPAESFGMTLAEANACGRPVVGSDVGGVPSFVTPYENGLLAPPGDAKALAAAIAEILDDRALARRLGEAGRAKVLAAHRWGALAEQTEEVLREAARRTLTAASSPAPGRTRA